MKTSAQGIELILEREGCRLEAYLDGVGVPTIAVGHTNGVKMGDTCTKEQAMQWLRDDLAIAEAAVNDLPCAFDQFQFDALVSFIFNVGVGAFQASTMRRMLTEGRADEVPAQFDRWHIPAEITSRRNAEREQFKGDAFEARIA